MAFTTVMIDPRATTAALKQGVDIGGKLLELTEKLKRPEIAHGVDYETYAGSRDPKFRTARLGDWARALIWEIDAHTLLIFDVAPNHEAASRASRNKVCRVSAVTRNLEIVTFREVEPAAAVEPALESPRLVPDHISDHDLHDLGVSSEVARIGRAIIDVDALDALARLMPSLERQLHTIQLLSEGMTREDVYREVSALTAEPADLEDHRSALLRSIKKQRIQVLASEEELVHAIQQPWDAWKVFLHPTQRALAYAPRYNGPCRVTGGPGTGKTIVAVHRVRALVESLGLLATGTPILLTAFITSMTEQLQGLVDALLTSEQRQRVSVTGIDKLVLATLKGAGHPRASAKLLDQSSAIDKRLDETASRRLVEWDTPRLRNFWDRVLLSMELRSWDEYSKLRRRVRKLPALDERTFTNIVRLAEEFETALVRNGETTFMLRTRDALECAVAPEEQFSYVVVDEAQDLHALHWRYVRRLVPAGPNDIFFVADCDQRLYRTAFPMSSCGIEIRNRSKRLAESYRCSQLILDFAYRILGVERGEDPDAEGVQAKATALFSGPAPTTMQADDLDSEARMLLTKIRHWHAEGVGYGDMLVCCVASKTQALVLRTLATAAIPAAIIGANERPTPGHVGVVTIFRSKGMEAQVAAVFGASAAHVDVSSMQPEDVERYRAALFVAATRAREQLHVTWSVRPTELLKVALAEEPSIHPSGM